MNYANIKFFDIANGEGVRTSLFVSGCRRHCVGCFNQIAWDFMYGEEYTKNVEDKIIESLKDPNIAGLTLLGGDPFEPENQKGLIPFLRRVKEVCPHKNIWAYSGYLMDSDMQEGGVVYTKYTKEMLSYIDVLVDGPFVLELKDISLRFRGSSNQRIIDVKKTLETNSIVLIDRLMERELL
jgi:anaerobic ribonucleoside-triphosphate reductase activating protein